jgi:hypothetical protein
VLQTVVLVVRLDNLGQSLTQHMVVVEEEIQMQVMTE